MEGDHSGDPGVEGKVMLKWILNRYSMKEWNGLTGFQCSVEGKPGICHSPRIFGENQNLRKEGNIVINIVTCTPWSRRCLVTCKT
jgi:hypothetical protein